MQFEVGDIVLPNIKAGIWNPEFVSSGTKGLVVDVDSIHKKYKVEWGGPGNKFYVAGGAGWYINEGELISANPKTLNKVLHYRLSLDLHEV